MKAVQLHAAVHTDPAERVRERGALLTVSTRAGDARSAVPLHHVECTEQRVYARDVLRRFSTTFADAQNLSAIEDRSVGARSCARRKIMHTLQQCTHAIRDVILMRKTVLDQWRAPRVRGAPLGRGTPAGIDTICAIKSKI